VQILANDELRAERFSEVWRARPTSWPASFTNVAKHAGTDGARVRLSHSGSQLCLVVEDDGGASSRTARSEVVTFATASRRYTASSGRAIWGRNSVAPNSHS
jgi:signal transduction histidine kinase